MKLTAVAVILLVFGTVGGAFLAYNLLTSEATLTPTPSFHVDVGTTANDATSTGNSYVEDPNDDLFGDDQLMTVTTPLTPCATFTVTDFDNTGATDIFTDIIIENAQELVGADVRINFDPSLIQFVSSTVTPFTAAEEFTGWSGADVGLINLPVPPYDVEENPHRSASTAFASNNTDGAVFLAGTYQGDRSFKVSSESGPDIDLVSGTPTNSLPDRNAGMAPDGGVFVRVKWRVLAATSAAWGPALGCWSHPEG